MRIDNCVRIMDGVLCTTPSIDAYERVIFESQKVIRGDLFFDLRDSKENTKEAIRNGAYAVVSTRAFKDEDEEIAWIQVEKIEQSLIKLLRYTITHKNLQFINASPLQSDLLEMLHFPKTIKFLKGSLEESSLAIFKAKEKDTFCLSDTILIKDIAPNALSIKKLLHVNTFSLKGLFLTSFLRQEAYHAEQKIPSLFLLALNEVFDFCEQHSLAYDIHALTFTEHFYPQFVTPSLRKKEFGGADKVLIFESSPLLLMDEIAYMQAHVSSTSWLLCLPENEKNTFTCKAQIHTYCAPADLAVLRESTFQYALILGNREAFEPLLTQTFTSQPSLF